MMVSEQASLHCKSSRVSVSLALFFYFSNKLSTSLSFSLSPFLFSVYINIMIEIDLEYPSCFAVGGYVMSFGDELEMARHSVAKKLFLCDCIGKKKVCFEHFPRFAFPFLSQLGFL